MAGGNEPNDKWGSVLETGDFDGDGFHDLAIGTPNESIGSILEAGAVTLVYGSSTGLDGAVPDFFTKTHLVSQEVRNLLIIGGFNNVCRFEC